MKLKQEDIKFIDNYLSVNVEHLDIRLEMVDHVATAIETKIENGDSREFYYIFKDYMVENKKKLLDNNKQFLKTATKKLSNEIIKCFTKPLHLLLMLLISAFSYYSFMYFGFGTTKSVLFILIFTPTIIYLIASKYYKYNRFSSTERINYFLVILVQLINLINLLNTKLIPEYTHVIVMSLVFGMLFNFVVSLSIVSIDTFKACKSQYQTIL